MEARVNGVEMLGRGTARCDSEDNTVSRQGTVIVDISDEWIKLLNVGVSPEHDFLPGRVPK
jgi:hypothetical protein